MGATRKKEEPLLSLFAELVLDKATEEFNEKRLRASIDAALDVGDKKLFYELTEELNKCQKLMK